MMICVPLTGLRQSGKAVLSGGAKGQLGGNSLFEKGKPFSGYN